MGFLSMIGAVSAEEHAKVKKERDDARTKAASEEAAGAQTAIELAAAKRDAATLRTNAGFDREAIEKQQRKIEELNAEIAALKPDAEAMRKKRRDDRDREAAKRLKAATAKLDAEFGKTSTSPANIGVRKKPYRIDLKPAGKPRTSIPAKVGKTASAKLSGDRPAKKAVRK